MKRLAPSGLVLALALGTSGCKELEALEAVGSMDPDAAVETSTSGAGPDAHVEPPPDASANRDAPGEDAGSPADAVDASSADVCTVLATTQISLRANLDSHSTPPTADFDSQSPVATSNFTTSQTIYDSLGRAHAVGLYFAMQAPGDWSYYALARGAEVAGGTLGQNVVFAAGTLTFDTSAALLADTPSGGTVTFVGAAPQIVSFDLGTPIAVGGSGIDGLRDYAMASGVIAQSQNGNICW